ncbi:30S ribosomal protein S3 [Halobacterium hubeiense]|jgi:small subunit ribosomal protein S3|uniref:Small ribosomal subunit protein uS3 n=1 Tax=Halobacterium hubeiense TaxID=1407499 RepID=A0A0U5H481_9EURY|nr:30S ribosomal protein S3 [Halobacterium hubeiense]CQH60245.1 30S ribosomal protein S3 [Halobacterium hubeiense]
MADEMEFIEQGLQRSQIDEFFAEELARAGYGGMELAPTPMGMQIVLKAEKPGMVIGKGGKNIRKITTQLEERFDLEDPQIDVQEVDEPDLNAQIVADRLANALERGWYFRKAGHTTIDRIMEAGALGAEIVLSGKVTGNRGRVEKFNRGYIKHNGEPAEEIVDHGKGVAVMKLGTIGVSVKIIPPNAKLPDDFEIQEDANIEDLVVDEEEAGEELEELLEGEGEEAEAAEGEAPGEAATAVDDDRAQEEIVEEEPEGGSRPERHDKEGKSATSPPDSTNADVEEDLDELAADVEAEAEDVEAEDFDELESDAEETAEELLEEMEEESEEGEE